MLIDSQRYKDIHSKQRVRRTRERVIIAAILLVLALGNLPQPAFASPAEPQTGTPGYVLRVRPLGLRKLCVGDKVTFNINLADQRTTQVSGTQITSQYFIPNWRLNSQANPRGIGTLSGALPIIGSPPGKTLIFTATKAGSTTITFSAPSHGNASKDVPIKVLDCKWEIETWSKWTKSNGFKPRMVSHLEPAQFSADQDGKFDITADVKNQATPGFQVCSVTMSVTESKANVKGRRSDANVLTFGLKFAAYSISASTSVVCPYASGGNTGSAKIINVNQVVFDGLSVPSGGGAIIKPTTVVTDTTERGAILIIILPIDTNGNYYLNP